MRSFRRVFIAAVVLVGAQACVVNPVPTPGDPQLRAATPSDDGDERQGVITAGADDNSAHDNSSADGTGNKTADANFGGARPTPPAGGSGEATDAPGAATPDCDGVEPGDGERPVLGDRVT